MTTRTQGQLPQASVIEGIQRGDMVEILTGKRAGQVVRVRAVWVDCNGVPRLDVGGLGGIRKISAVRKAA